MNNNFSYALKKIKTKSVEGEFEACGIETRIASKTLKILLLYRPSNQKSNSKMDKFFERLGDLVEKNSTADCEIILMGDMNINLLEKNPHSTNLIELLSTFNLKLLNEHLPTRIATTSRTMIDHFFSNLDCTYQMSIEQICFSDHESVQCDFEIHLEPLKDKFKWIRIYSDENWKSFFEILSTETWTDVYSAPNVDTMSVIFMEKLINYFEQAFPLKKTTIRANQQDKIQLSIATQELKTRVREFGEKICRENDQSKKLSLRNQYKTMKSYLGFCINNERRQINDKKIRNSTNKSKTAWQLINTHTGKQQLSTTINKLKVNGEDLSNQKDISNYLNKKFVEPLPDISNNTLDLVIEHIPKCNKKLRLVFMSEYEVLEIIKNLPSKNSVSWDGISTKVVKQIANFILKPQQCIINQSFREGKFPRNLLLSLVTPSFKKGEREDASNYRPIAMTSPFSKILEKAFLSRLENHLVENNILTDQQHGFTKGKSTVTALFEVVSEIYNCLENKEKVNLILYDFSNAFGCLVPQLLLKKLERYGVCDEALSWVSTFLIGRTQIVQLKSLDSDNNEIITKSEVADCSMGVPQGTVLGPVGFTVYDNDFPLKIILACLYLYADDSSVVVRAKNYPELNTKTEIANQNVMDFAKSNFLRLNAKKTNLLHIHTAQTKSVVNPHITVNEEEVSVSQVGKILGVTITDTFNWKAHCEEVASKLRSTAYRFSMLRATLTLPSIKLVYFAHVQSHILYTIIIWGGSPHLEQIFIAQKRCVRAMAGKRYWRGPAALDSCKPLFREFKILTVYCLYILESAKFVRKYPEKFSKNTDHPHTFRQTRNTTHKENDLFVQTCRNTSFVQNPLVMMARIWNHLPDSIKTIENDKLLSKKLKILLLKYAFYDMHEFFSCKFDDVF